MEQGHCSVTIFYNFATLAQNIHGLNYSRMVFQTAKTMKISSHENLSAYGTFGTLKYDVVEAHAMVANFLSRYFEHFS